MYSTRGALALLWRAAMDPGGSRMWSQDEFDCGQALARAHLGEYRVLQPEKRDEPDRHIFVITPEGDALWRDLLSMLSDRIVEEEERAALEGEGR